MKSLRVAGFSYPYPPPSLNFPDELVVFCPLTPFQEDVYQTLLQNPDVELVRKKNFPCDCGSGVDRGKCCYMVGTVDYTSEKKYP